MAQEFYSQIDQAAELLEQIRRQEVEAIVKEIKLSEMGEPPKGAFAQGGESVYSQVSGRNFDGKSVILGNEVTNMERTSKGTSCSHGNWGNSFFQQLKVLVSSWHLQGPTAQSLHLVSLFATSQTETNILACNSKPQNSQTNAAKLIKISRFITVHSVNNSASFC